MDHLPHSLSGQSQTTHHQPRLHRRSRPATLWTQRRLPRRIQRRRSTHSPAPDLRRYLCTLISQRDSRSGRKLEFDRALAAAWNSAKTRGSDSLAPAPPSPQISPTLPRPPNSSPRPSLPINNCPCSGREGHDFSLEPALSERSAPKGAVRSCYRTAASAAEVFNWPLTTDHWPLLFCERTMNSTCGKQIHHPRTKAVIAEDTTYGVSLLTGTISGSNFAFP